MNLKQLISLITRIRSDKNDPDTEAEQLLITEFLPQIAFKIRHRLTSKSEDVEDLIQDVAIKLIGSLRNGNFDPEQAKLGSYINGIVNHCLSKYFEGKSKRQSVEIDENIIKDMISMPQYGENYDVEKLIECLRKHLPLLPENYREVYLLFYFEQLSIQEISKKLGRAPAIISNEKFQARETMKKWCYDKFYSQ